jgi:hypothetical protein
MKKISRSGEADQEFSRTEADDRAGVRSRTALINTARGLTKSYGERLRAAIRAT